MAWATQRNEASKGLERLDLLTMFDLSLHEKNSMQEMVGVLEGLPIGKEPSESSNQSKIRTPLNSGNLKFSKFLKLRPAALQLAVMFN